MKRDKPSWVTKKKDTVYENPWIKVSHHEVVTPGNTNGVYGVVQFKNRAVGVIPIDDKGNTWLVGQSRYPLDHFSWEIPEGGVPLDEEPICGAKRELAEEVGLSAQHWELIQTLHLSNSVTDEVAYIFVAKGLTMGLQNLDETEDIQVMKLPLADAIIMAKNGEITDAISVAGLLRVALEL